MLEGLGLVPIAQWLYSNNLTAFFFYYYCFPCSGFPDTLPALTPAPPKKSKIKSASVHFEDEDPEERLESHDRHITAVFSKIIVCLFFV